MLQDPDHEREQRQPPHGGRRGPVQRHGEHHQCDHSDPGGDLLPEEPPVRVRVEDHLLTGHELELWACHEGIVVNSAGGTLRCHRGRRGDLRDRRRLSPADQLPRPHLRHPRGSARHRGHVGPVPVPGRAVRQRHAHARLQLQAVDRARRRSPTGRRSCRTCARRSPSTASTATSGSTTSSRRPSGRPTTHDGR